MLHHPPNKPHVWAFCGVISPVETPIEPVCLFLGPGSEPEGALGRLERYRVDGADHSRCCYDKGKLPEDLTGNAGEKRSGEKNRDQGHGDAHDGSQELRHGLNGRFFGFETSLDVIGAVLHNNDGIIHHDAYGKDKTEKGHEIDAETQGHHGNGSAYDGYGHGRGRHQEGTKALEKDHDNDENEDARLGKCLIDL